MECTKLNCPMQVGTVTENCSDSCPWRTTMKLDDLISRAATLEALGECPYNWNDWPEEIQAVYDWESHKEVIENIPAVDAAPVVHGRWSEKRWMTDDDWGVINHRAIVCSACKGEIADGEKTRYCPNCGAKMDGRDSE